MSEKVIMMIDDDADDRKFFKEALIEIYPSYIFLEAIGCIEAFKLLRKTEQLPDFIFLDINMPRLDGRECLKELKRDVKFNSIPMIMYSTSFNDKSVAEFYALGASGYLNKPNDTNKLPAQISEAIRRYFH